jgi:hypothetical protein
MGVQYNESVMGGGGAPERLHASFRHIGAAEIELGERRQAYQCSHAIGVWVVRNKYLYKYLYPYSQRRILSKSWERVTSPKELYTRDIATIRR